LTPPCCGRLSGYSSCSERQASQYAAAAVGHEWVGQPHRIGIAVFQQAVLGAAEHFGQWIPVFEPRHVVEERGQFHGAD